MLAVQAEPEFFKKRQTLLHFISSSANFAPGAYEEKAELDH